MKERKKESESERERPKEKDDVEKEITKLHSAPCGNLKLREREEVEELSGNFSDFSRAKVMLGDVTFRLNCN